MSKAILDHLAPAKPPAAFRNQLYQPRSEEAPSQTTESWKGIVIVIQATHFPGHLFASKFDLCALSHLIPMIALWLGQGN